MKGDKKYQFSESKKPQVSETPKYVPTAADQNKFSSSKSSGSGKRTASFLVLGVLIVLFLALVGAYFFLITQKNQNDNLVVPNINTNKTDINETCISDLCLLQIAQTQNDSQTCDKIADSAVKQSCYTGFVNFSVSACTNVYDYSVRSVCIKKFALQTNSVDLCRKLNSADVKSCVESVAPCYYKTGDEFRFCYAVSKIDYTLCGSDDNCLINFAQNFKNNSACDGISNMASQGLCNSVAAGTDLCGNLSVVANQDSCRELYAKKTNDISICQYTTQGSIYELNCYAYFAITTKNTNLCKKVDLLNKWNCYQNYSWTSGDIAGCDAIEAGSVLSRSLCYVQYAKIFGNPSTCEIISNIGSKPACYLGAMDNNPNLKPENCAGMALDSWKVRCYLDSAILYNDTNICLKYLNESSDKIFCVENANFAIAQKTNKTS